MRIFVATGTAATISSLLIMSGLHHALRLGAFRRTLVSQGFGARFIARYIALGVAAAELSLAVILGVALVTTSAGPIRIGLAVSGLLFTGFTVNTWRLLRQGAHVPCGCDANQEAPVSQVTLARAAALAATCAVAAMFVLPSGIDGLQAERIWLLAAAGTALAAIVWTLPDALAGPVSKPKGAFS